MNTEHFYLYCSLSHLPTPQSTHVNSSATNSKALQVVQTQQQVSPSVIFLTAPMSQGSEQRDLGMKTV